jgi:predicted nucleic acid-binding protein
VACAKEGEADYIIGSDQDPLILDEYDGVQIVTPR